MIDHNDNMAPRPIFHVAFIGALLSKSSLHSSTLLPLRTFHLFPLPTTHESRTAALAVLPAFKLPNRSDNANDAFGPHLDSTEELVSKKRIPVDGQPATNSHQKSDTTTANTAATKVGGDDAWMLYYDQN
eukprot:scaffold15025_cov72-Skeletonema_marinoi.AAC.2